MSLKVKIFPTPYDLLNFSICFALPYARLARAQNVGTEMSFVQTILEE